MSARTPARVWAYLGSPWVVVGVAVVMVALVCIPASLWRAPAYDVTSAGFDTTLMYSETDGRSPGRGAYFHDDSLTLTSQQGSETVVHLVATPMTFESQFDLTVDRADRGSGPVSIALTAPYLQHEVRLLLGGEPSRTVSVQRIKDGAVVDERELGIYSIGETYHVTANVDRVGSTASITMAPLDEHETFRGVLLNDKGEPYRSRILTADPVSVSPGQDYELNADILPLVDGLVGVTVEWLDAAGKRIGIAPVWRPFATDGLWHGVQVSAVAPAGAVLARQEIAVAGGGSAGVARVRFAAVGGSGTNLLDNGGFEAGTSGWRRTAGSDPLEVREYRETAFEVAADAASFPELFGALRMAATLRSTAGDGVSQANLANYLVQVPHQRWMASRVADWRATAAVALLALAGAAVVAPGIRRRWLRGWSRHRAWTVTTRSWPYAVGFLAYGALCLWFSGIGSLNADIIGARVWGYTAATHDLSDIYFLPNVSSAEAGQWQGHAWQEAGFPYGPTMAYVFGIIGLVYRLGVHQPALGIDDAAAIDLVVRLTNGFFGLLSAVLIAAIVEGLGVRRASAWRVAMVFLLAPALVFAGSVWGSTQAISLVFILAAIWFAVRRDGPAAWVFVILAAMTRPQNLVVAVVVALYLARRAPLRATLRHVSLALAACFVFIAPLLVATAPSLPVDVLWNTFFMHVGDGNDPWTMPVSWGVFSPWQIVVGLLEGVGGVEATLFPATVTKGLLSYYTWGTVAFVALMLLVAVTVLARGRRPQSPGWFLLPAMLAILGLLLIKTGAPSYHMMLPTALSFLLRSELPAAAYRFVTGALSITTITSMYGMGAYWLTKHPTWSVGIYDPDLAITRLFAAAVDTPAVVIALSLVNSAVLLIVGYFAVRPLRRTTSGRAASASHETTPVSSPVASGELAVHVGDASGSEDGEA